MAKENGKMEIAVEAILLVDEKKGIYGIKLSAPDDVLEKIASGEIPGLEFLQSKIARPFTHGPGEYWIEIVSS